MPKNHASSGPPVRPPDGPPKNRLLAALPADDYRRLLPHLKTVPIRVKQVLCKQGEAIQRVFFPNGGVCPTRGDARVCGTNDHAESGALLHSFPCRSLVTGASRGVGRGVAISLTEAGYTV